MSKNDDLISLSSKMAFLTTSLFKHVFGFKYICLKFLVDSLCLGKKKKLLNEASDINLIGLLKRIIQ